MISRDQLIDDLAGIVYREQPSDCVCVAPPQYADVTEELDAALAAINERIRQHVAGVLDVAVGPRSRPVAETERPTQDCPFCPPGNQPACDCCDGTGKLPVYWRTP